MAQRPLAGIRVNSVSLQNQIETTVQLWSVRTFGFQNYRYANVAGLAQRMGKCPNGRQMGFRRMSLSRNVRANWQERVTTNYRLPSPVLCTISDVLSSKFNH